MPGDEGLDDAVARSDVAGSPPVPSDESTFVARMLDSEPHHMPHPDYIRLCQTRAVYLISRQDSINNILKVHAHFGFKPVTAFLSVNYMDRFLSSHHTRMETGWPFELLSMACLSLAAKMEELNVPLLLDLQMLETTNVFEPKTVMKMELVVLATLKWRLRSVTPFNYLHYFISMLPSSSSSDSVSTIHTFASDIIVNTTRVLDFTGFPPSVLAAASVISAAGQGLTLPDTYDERINREMVRSCHQLIEEYMLDTCPCQSLKAISAEPDAPPSPMGVLDAAACPSCDPHSENPSSAPGSGEADRETKRLRLSTPDVHEP